MKNIYHSDFLRKNTFAGNGIALVCIVLFLLSVVKVKAQSGTWTSANNSGGGAGSLDLGSGVYRLLSDVNTGQQAAAVHNTTAGTRINPAGDFTLTYQVFFGCPGNDQIGSDVNGDGMAFSLWKSSASYTVGAGGGGLGYEGQGGAGNMFTIEFDTYSSAFDIGNGFTYGGGTTGNNDELSIHRDGNAQTTGILKNANAGNLEDGLEHTVKFTYVASTKRFSVDIDGVERIFIVYDLGAYFGSGAMLNRTWSSAKEGATNPSTVNDGTIGQLILPRWTASGLGGSFCPTSVEITSPSNNSVFTGCPVAPITIEASAIPPAGESVTRVEFYLDGTTDLICTDNTAPYSCTWTSPTYGGHTLTAKAYYSLSSPLISAGNEIVVGDVLRATTGPTIDGVEDAMWSTFGYKNLTNVATGPGLSAPTNAADLSAKYKMTYTTTHLYVLVNVTDNQLRSNNGGAPWAFDAIEMFIDKDDKNNTSYGTGTTNYQLGFGYNANSGTVNPYTGTGGGGSSTAMPGVNAKQTTKAGGLGYIMEFSIPWTSIGFTAGQYPGDGINTPNMGFNIGIDDNDNGSSRETLLNWYGTSDQNYANPSLFGTVNFSNCNPLPVTWLNFTAAPLNDNVVLNWATVTETNNLKFVIERSSNGQNWTAIGEVGGSGNSSAVKKYSFTDYEAEGGINYYRLRQVDVDGAYDYSSVTVIEKSGKQSVSIAPNPFSDMITIRSSIEGVMNIKIYDILGRIVFQLSKEAADGMLTLQPELSSGTYIITIQSDTFVEQQKIIKN